MVTSALVPGLLPCAIHGHPYLCDPTIERETVQVIRQQSDTSSEPGEQSLTPLGLWRRSRESWHHGAGQEFLDGRSEEAADPHRYRSSKGIDPWTRGQLSLLHPTLKFWSTSGTNLFLTVVSDGVSFYLMFSDGTEVYYAQLPYGMLNTFAAQTGTGWTTSNCTIAAASFGSNAGYFRLTATASAAISATSPAGTGGMPVIEGREYGFLFYSKNISGSGAKTPTILVNWYDAAGVLLSSSTPVTGGIESGGTPYATDHEVAPAGAAFASITIGYSTNLTSGDIHEGIATLGPYEAVVSPPGAPDVAYPVQIQAGEAAQTVQSLASNGTYTWAALGTSGLHRNTAGGLSSTANVPAAPGSGQISLVGWANGFLLAAGSAGVSSSRENSLWVVTDPLGTPALSLIKTHPNTSFKWTGIAPGRNCVYAFGNSGGNGEVYKILFDPNTGALSTAASFATYLPDGESIHALTFYAGGIIMGTGKGLRLGQASGDGNIDYGPLIPTEWPVRCIEPQDRYVWFGWTKYDGTNSGLGRADLGFFTDTLTPAWSSDLMTDDASTGDVVSCVTFSPYGYTANQRPPVRVFSVAGEGIYIEDPTWRVPEGVIETGTIRFSTSEPKTTRSLDVRHHALPAGGPIAVEMQRDTSGTWTSVGSSSTTGSYGPATPLDLQDLNAEAMEFRFTLDRPDNNGTDFTRSPELTRWTAKVLPLPSTIDETFTLTLHMFSTVDTTAADGQPYRIDVPAEVTFLKALERARTIVEFQIGSDVHEGYVLSTKFTGDHWNGPKREFAEGKLAVTMQTVRG